MTSTVHATISGFVVGQIWMPKTECYKPFDYDCKREQARTTGKMTLRDHVLQITNDGDFQSCAVADAVLTLTIRKREGTRSVTKCKHYNLAQFPSIMDCVKTDWDGPIGDYD